MQLTRVRPPGVVPNAWRAASGAWTKLDGYVGRFAVYPRLVRNLDVDVTHVVDHGQGLAPEEAATLEAIIELFPILSRVRASPRTTR